jgi:hypothetical protein
MHETGPFVKADPDYRVLLLAQAPNFLCSGPLFIPMNASIQSEAKLISAEFEHFL